MNNYTDHAWTALKINKTEFTEGVFTFNGCKVEIIRRQEPYSYKTNTGRTSTMSARYWGKITLSDGIEDIFKSERGGAIARKTGFSLKEERELYQLLGDKYILPYMRD